MNFEGIYAGGFDPYTVTSYTFDTTTDAIRCSGVFVPDEFSALLVFVEEDVYRRLFFAEFISPDTTLTFNIREISLSTDISYYLHRASIFSIDQAYFVGAATTFNYNPLPKESGFIHGFPNIGDTCIPHGSWTDHTIELTLYTLATFYREPADLLATELLSLETIEMIQTDFAFEDITLSQLKPPCDRSYLVINPLTDIAD